MIKNYEQFNESLRDKLVGPTEDEIMNNLKDLSPDKLLLKSCQIGFIKGIELALEKGADVHYNNEQALRWASEEGNTEIVKCLLDLGVDVNVNNDQALQWACSNGHTETVKLLLDNGADVHVNNDAPLRYVIQKGHTETVELLKKYMEK